MNLGDNPALFTLFTAPAVSSVAHFGDGDSAIISFFCRCIFLIFAFLPFRLHLITNHHVYLGPVSLLLLSRSHQIYHFNGTGTMRCYNVPWLFLAAAVLPLSGAEDCVKDFRAIHELEAAVEDTSVVRKYVICPYRLMKIGNLDFDNNLIDGNDDDINPPLPLRPNMHILCGEQGSKGNLCFVRDGHLQMDGTSIRGIQNPTVDNILIEGFTFIGALHHSLFVTKPGSITFRNCEWRVGLGQLLPDLHR